MKKILPYILTIIILFSFVAFIGYRNLDNESLKNVSPLFGAPVLQVIQGGTGANTLTGCLEGNGTSAITGTGVACGSGSGGSFPWTVNAWGNSTTSTLGFLNGFLSTASSTISAPLRLSSLGQGFTGIGSGGLIYPIASSTINLSWFNNDSNFLTSYTSPYEIATTSSITAPQLAYFTQIGGRTTLGSVATGTISVPTGLTITPNRSVIGGSATIGLDTGYVIPLQSTLDGLVPYTGATQDLDLGTVDLVLNNVGFSGDTANNFSLYRTGDGVRSNFDISLLSLDRTYTLPDKNLTLAGINNETFTGLTTMSYSSSTVYSSFLVASSTQWVGGGLQACNATTGKLNWDSTTKQFKCDTDQTGGAGSSAYEIATTSDIALSGIAYFTKTSGLTTLGSVATGTISVPTGLTVTANRYTLGGATAIGLDTGYVIPLQSTLDAKALGATTMTIAGTANQITSSAGAQDLSTNRTWTLSFPNQIIFPQYASSTLGFSTPYASSTALHIGTGQGVAFVGSDGKVGVTATSSFSLSQFTNNLASLTAGSGLSSAGTYNGATARTFSIDNGYANTWTVLQTFNYSSSTAYSSFNIASSTNWYGGGLTTCSGSNFLQWTGGFFACGTPSGSGTVTSVVAGVGFQNRGLNITSSGTLNVGIATSSNPTIGDLAMWTATGDASNPATLGTISTSTLVNNIFPFTSYGISTSSIFGFTGGLFSTASSTFSSGLYLTGLNSTQGALYTGSNGNVRTVATTTTTCTNQFARTVSAFGVATCATVSASDVSLANLTATDSTLTFSGTYNGSTARTIGLNLGNANTWTAKQTFGNASSTQLSASDWFGLPNGTSPSLTAIGSLALDTTSNNLVFATSTQGNAIVVSSATTTLYALTATTSPYVSGSTVDFPPHHLPQAATAVSCKVTSGTSFQITFSDGTNSTNTVTCSTTWTQYALTTNNTWTAGERFLMTFGTKTGTTGDIVIRVLGYRTSD